VFTFSGTVTLASIDTAIQNVADARSTFGSVQNRLEHTLNNLANYQENLTSAESRIRDVDMAAEMVTFTKLQILQQAGTSMLAQANQASQGVLSLLR
jgi:flagellin